MLCYIAIRLAEEFESKYSKGKKGKQTVSASLSWDKERLNLIKILVHLSGLELMDLWEPSSAPMMEDLSALFASLCYTCLENTSVVRDKVLLDNISELLGFIIKKYGLTLSKC